MTNTNSLRTGAGYALEVDLDAAYRAMIEAADTIDALRAENERLRACFDWANGAAEEGWLPAQEVRKLRAQLAEAQSRIKELETPTMFWDFDNPEHGAFDSPHNLICDGDFDEGAEVSFMTARSLPAVSVRVTRDNDGNYNYEYIDVAKEPSDAA